MFWIGKASNLVPANVQNEQSEETAQQQSATSISSLGISASSDQFETTNPTVSTYGHSWSLPQLKNPVVTNEATQEMVNAEGIFESLNNIHSDLFELKPKKTSQALEPWLPPESPQPPVGKIDYDSLLAVKEKLLQDPMDWNGIFNALEQIPNKSDYFATISELCKDGNWEKFLEKLPPEADGKLLEHLVSAAQNRESDQTDGAAMNFMLKGIRDLELSTAGGNGRFSGIIRELIRSKNLDGQEYCFQILDSDTSPENRLVNLFAMQQLRSYGGPYVGPNFGPKQIQAQIQKFFEDYATGVLQVPAPGIQKAWEEFPELSQDQLKSYADPSTFASKLIESGENIAPALSKFITDSPSNSEFSHIWLEPFFSALGDNDPAKADDIVREVINNSNAADLSQLSPGLLIELKLVLMRGDDTDLNQQMINEAINPAYEIAKNN